MIFGGILAVIASYFLGSVSSSILIGHMFGVEDIRKHGSGNAGSTNVLRTIGKKAAALTFVSDVLKGVIPIVVINLFWTQHKLLFMTCAGAAVVLGHIFPAYFGFKGGKGVATSFGVVIAMSPCTGIWWIPLLLFGIWLVVVLITRYVSLASVAVMALYPVVISVLFRGLPVFEYVNYIMFTAFIGVLSIFMHRKNIGRLMHGTESKIGKK
ncbi:MAG: glycerol-3-phosphate 1-O-acyltransferase PlsY [Bacillota bacterium]|nr:glycerol-3-phosphate 1-O-acyltransferase PlsY [Bacillota bacterium]